MSDGKSIFDVHKTADSICFTFASILKNIDAVCDRTARFLQSRVENIDKEQFSINLVIREGLTNAVRHGNKSDPEKNVKFSVIVEDHQVLKLVIEDQGDGFDWEKQQTELICEEDDHGRGFLIMATYFNSYSYNDKGNILYLKKDISQN